MPKFSPEAVPTPPAPKRPRSAQDTALKTFIKELKGTARGTLRGKPGLLAKLEL